VSSGTDSTVREKTPALAPGLDAELDELRRARPAAPEGGEGAAPRVVVIKPPGRWPTIDLRELWAYRELALTFAWRDFRVRYKQTFIGATWAIIQPLMQMVVFTVVFGKFAKFPTSGNLSYPIFSYGGLLLWAYFQSALQRSSTCLVSGAGFVTKVYFPRVLLPLASVTSPLVDFFFSGLVLVGLMAYFQVVPSITVLVAPLFILLALMTAAGVGMLLAAVNVRFRDVPYVIPFMLQTWMFLSPVLYATDAPGLRRWQWVYAANPMNGVISGFRWALLGSTRPQGAQLGLSVGVALLLLLGGLAVFKRFEPRFADQM
jgi:homopolymeric O-antigen transport system permease protein